MTLEQVSYVLFSWSSTRVNARSSKSNAPIAAGDNRMESAGIARAGWGGTVEGGTRVKTLLLTLRVRFFIVIFACASNTSVLQAQQGPERPPVLSLEFSMRLSLPISAAVWSPDGRVLAAISAVHPALQLIHVDTQERKEWSPPLPFRLLSTAISADNQLLAVHQPSDGFNRLWLYSLANHKELAKAELPLGNCRPSSDLTGGGALVFSESALWLGCTAHGHVTGTYTAAVRLSSRDLQPQERIDLAPIADTPLSFLGGTSFCVHSAKLLFTQIVTTYTRGSPSPHIAQNFVRTIDLNTKQEAYPALKIRTESGVRLPSFLRYAMVSLEYHIAVVFRALVKLEPAPPVGTPDFAFETYDVRSGKLLSEFWSGKEQRDLETGGQVQDAALFPGSPYIVAAIDASFNPKKHGGLIVWDSRTGTLIQRVPGRSARGVSVSPDGERVALFNGRELLVYRRGR